MKLNVYFAILLVLGLAAPTIYCAQEHKVDMGQQLFDSIHDGDIVKAKQLIHEGANVNFKGINGITPLMVAVHLRNPDVELVRMLVNKGADVRAVDSSGTTPLQWIFTINDEEFRAIADILINAGANVNAQNKSGYTALHSAVGHTFYYGVKYLLSKGANADIKDKHNMRPVDFAAENNVELRNLLTSRV